MEKGIYTIITLITVLSIASIFLLHRAEKNNDRAIKILETALENYELKEKYRNELFITIDEDFTDTTFTFPDYYCGTIVHLKKGKIK